MSERTRFRTFVDTDGQKRRRKVVMHRGWEGYIIRWTQECSGCRYPDGSNAGCHECGFHGKVRCEFWVPFETGAFYAWEEQRYQRGKRLLAFWRSRRAA